MSRRAVQSRSREWDGLLRFEYAPTPSKRGGGETLDAVSALQRVVRDQGERIERLEAAWSMATQEKGRRYTRQ
jgi:hypothetical protein